MSVHPLGMVRPLEIVPPDPMQLWEQWFPDAQSSEPNGPNAAALATADTEGRPSVRMVLIKDVCNGVFSFFTNAESQKGEELGSNPHAALCLHWKSLRRQVRVQGTVTPLDDAAVDKYFHSRSRRSQIGAAVSQQSRPLPERKVLEDEVSVFEKEHPNEVPRPDFWRGYALHAEIMEFWSDGPDRLHDRVQYHCGEAGWTNQRLYP